MPLDRVDRRLLEVLQRDGRLSNVALAERVHLSPSPCLRRLKALEHDGVIEGYRAVLDREAVGLGLTVFVELKVEGHSEARGRPPSRRPSPSLPEVVACHLVSGAADFLLEVVVPDLRAYERLLLGSLLKLPLGGRRAVQLRDPHGQGARPAAARAPRLKNIGGRR